MPVIIKEHIMWKIGYGLETSSLSQNVMEFRKAGECLGSVCQFVNWHGIFYLQSPEIRILFELKKEEA